MFQNCSFIIIYVPTAELKRIMSNVWPIAIIALLTIVILFYALEQCGKILKGRQGRNLNKRSDKQRKTSNLDTIHEQHVSPSFHSSLHHLGSLRSRKKSHFTCILEHSVWKSQKKSHSKLRAKRATITCLNLKLTVKQCYQNFVLTKLFGTYSNPFKNPQK